MPLYEMRRLGSDGEIISSNPATFDGDSDALSHALHLAADCHAVEVWTQSRMIVRVPQQYVRQHDLD